MLGEGGGEACWVWGGGRRAGCGGGGEGVLGEGEGKIFDKLILHILNDLAKKNSNFFILFYIHIKLAKQKGCQFSIDDGMDGQ